MISARKIVDKLNSKNNNLIKSFYANTNYSFSFKDIKNFKKFKTVIVIGMGGSTLGTQAIYSFLKHKIKKKFIFIDNLDEEFLKKIKKYNNLAKSLFLIISKSGNTIETLVNTSYFKSFMNKKNVIIISEKKNNILYNFAQNNGFKFVKHNAHLGGRYSVFSEVSMLPAYLMGLVPKNFKKNLKNFLTNRKTLNSSIRQISRLNIKKSKVLILFNYVPELNDFMFWCQQLLAESLGKI